MGDAPNSPDTRGKPQDGAAHPALAACTWRLHPGEGRALLLHGFRLWLLCGEPLVPEQVMVEVAPAVENLVEKPQHGLLPSP